MSATSTIPAADEQASVGSRDSALPHDLPNPTRKRLLSIDALRGFDMLWIIGASWVFERAHRWIDADWTR